MSKSSEKKNPSKDRKPSAAAEKALEGLESLVLLDSVLKDPLGRALVRLIKWLAKDGETGLSRGVRRYGKLWRRVMDETTAGPVTGTLLQERLLDRLLDNDNPFHRQAEMEPLSRIHSSLHSVYQKELAILQRVLKTDWEAEFLKCAGFKVHPDIPSFQSVQVAKPKAEGPEHLKARRRMKERLLGSGGAELAAAMAEHFFQNGFGLFGHFRAFAWNGEEGLAGVEQPDPIRLEELVGYDAQRQPLLDTIEGFLAGKPSNNVLIYGERGTGKSSTVKALLNRYQDRGLRIVELHPSQLIEYPFVLPFLRGRREKFVLFVDDLSFEENETSYKGLKAILEGSVEARPSNVILIATSNRRHLIREFFDDRVGGLQDDGEIHGADTVEEKLSLSDRFGLVLSFYAPDQDTYLSMVENWAKVEGIRISPAELRSRALQWEKSNNVRSGRTARQFINDLKGRV